MCHDQWTGLEIGSVLVLCKKRYQVPRVSVVNCLLEQKLAGLAVIAC